jgi:hypothetical protein
MQRSPLSDCWVIEPDLVLDYIAAHNLKDTPGCKFRTQNEHDTAHL